MTSILLSDVGEHQHSEGQSLNLGSFAALPRDIIFDIFDLIAAGFQRDLITNIFMEELLNNPLDHINDELILTSEKKLAKMINHLNIVFITSLSKEFKNLFNEYEKIRQQNIENRLLFIPFHISFPNIYRSCITEITTKNRNDNFPSVYDMKNTSWKIISEIIESAKKDERHRRQKVHKIYFYVFEWSNKFAFCNKLQLNKNTRYIIEVALKSYIYDEEYDNITFCLRTSFLDFRWFFVHIMEEVRYHLQFEKTIINDGFLSCKHNKDIFIKSAHIFSSHFGNENLATILEFIMKISRASVMYFDFLNKNQEYYLSYETKNKALNKHSEKPINSLTEFIKYKKFYKKNYEKKSDKIFLGLELMLRSLYILFIGFRKNFIFI